MIAPMKKVTLVVMEKEREAALEELKRVGVMHLESRPVSSPELTALLEGKSRAESAFGLLLSYPVSKKKVPSDAGSAGELIARVLALSDEKKSRQEALSSDRKEISRIEAWGSFNPGDFAALASNGVELVPWELSLKNYQGLGADVKVFRLGSSKGKVRVLAVGAPLSVLPERIGEDVPVALPSRSLSELIESTAVHEARLREIEGELAALAPGSGLIKAEILRITSAVEFEAARIGMDSMADAPESLSVAWFSGFVPTDDVGRIKKAAAEQGWALLADDPRDDELPPTKVNNPIAVRIIQPVFSFLGIIPNYREYEISAWFLIFFSIFFAMIFGDAGYGSLLFLSGLIFAFKAKRAGKPVPDMVRLLLVLSTMTIIWGTLTMSWFGLAPERVPSVLRSLDIYWLSNENPMSGDNIKLFCFILGTVQLVIAHAKNIKRDSSSLKVLAQVGQMAMVIGMMNLVLNLVISPDRFPMPTWAIWTIAVGFGLNFVFAGYEAGGNPVIAVGRSILASFANFISMFLGVVNVFADIISYIRLWAVGLAGVAISQTVNSLVEPLLSHFLLFIVGGFILLFGHGLNIMMSFLSVIVHGVRLNVLEFSSHLGMEWSGYQYDPFREKGPSAESHENNTTTTKEQS